MVHVVVIVIPVRIQIHLMHLIVKLLVMMVAVIHAQTVNLIGLLTALSAVMQQPMRLVLTVLA
jgi:hypothetical protein